MDRAVLRLWIIRVLCMGGLLLLALAVAGALWGTLGGLGDTTGARIARGITVGLAVCWGANLVGLLVLLALGQVTTLDALAGPASPASERSADSGGRGVTI